MVAVTVIVAATIAVFVLDIGESTSANPPAAGFNAEQDEMRLEAYYDHAGNFYVLEITYTSGDPIPEDQLHVRVNGQQAWGATTNYVTERSRAAALLSDSSSLFRPGETITVVHTDDPSITINDGDTYTINVPPFGNPVEGENDPEENRLYQRGSSPQLQLEPGDRITITWESERGDETATLFEREIESFD